jgi:hypothetical protein
MRRRARGVSFAGALALSVQVCACALVSGLDSIKENNCVPDLCGDGSPLPAADAVGAGDTPVAFDAPVTPPAPDAPADVPVGTIDDAGGEPADAGSDAPPEGTEASADVSIADAMPTGAIDVAADDAVGIDAATDSAVDSGAECGSPGDPDNCGSCNTRCTACAGARVCTGGGCGGGTVYFYEPFDGNAQGWSLDATWTIAAECAAPPAPQKGNPDPTVDHTSPGGTSGVAGAYVCGNTPQRIAPYRYATSPAVDTSAAPTLMLTFYRWLNSDESQYMASTVEVFDGSSWVPIYTNPSSGLVTDAAWTKEEYDVTQYKGSAFRVRFGYALVSGSVYSMSGWNIDDVTLSATSCP